MREIVCKFEKKPELSVTFNYYVYLPKDYDANFQKKWPLILFLHGAGERGDSEQDLHKVKVIGVPKYLQDKEDFPFIAVCPQCPANSFWAVQAENLNFFLDDVINTYNVDRNRVYLTGLSMGGYGTWFLGMAHAEKFAAIAPVCGGGMPWNASTLAKTPVWAFHGEKDNVVSFSESERMVNALIAAGGNVKFTSYPDAYHDSWTPTYNNPELYEWFLSHKKE